MYDEPLIITGCPRTGTTAIAHALSLHPNICILHETCVYDLDDEEGASKRPYDSEEFPMPVEAARAAALTAIRKGERSNERIRKAIFDAVARQKRLHVYGDKLLNAYLKQMGRLHRRYPGARFIVMLRDGRDVIASQIRWHNNRVVQGAPIEYWMAPTVAKAQWVWLEAMRMWERARKRLPPECWIEVKYERAAEAPEETMREICELVELAYDPETFRESVAQIHPVRVGQWRKDLPNLEQQLSWRFRRTLRAWGYE